MQATVPVVRVPCAATLYFDHRRLVLKEVSRWSGTISAEGLADLEQDGWLGLLVALGKFDSAVGVKFSTFAFTRIRKRVTHAAARIRRSTVNNVPEDSLEQVYAQAPGALHPSAEELFSRAQQDNLVREAFDCLPPAEAAVVGEVFWSGKRQADVAREMGVSRSRVNNLLRSAYARMHKFIRDHR